MRTDHGNRLLWGAHRLQPGVRHLLLQFAVFELLQLALLVLLLEFDHHDAQFVSALRLLLVECLQLHLVLVHHLILLLRQLFNLLL